MGIRKEYIREAVDVISKMEPDLDRDEIEKIVSQKVKERLTNPTIIMDNNVTKVNKRIRLTDLCSWLDNERPVISGNATFFMQPNVLRSPTSNMLIALKALRKNTKKEMFKYKPEDSEYQQLDLAQLNTKVIMNAEYGASGSPTAAFYTKYTPAATTLLAQSIITTIAAFFEGYIGANQKYFHINECIDWMNAVCKNKNKVHKWIYVPTVPEVFDKIKRSFFMYDYGDDKTIENYLGNCSRDELVYIFYANNMKGFIRNHLVVRELIRSVLTTLPLYEASEMDIPDEFKSKHGTIKEYNEWISNEMFLNPYKPPVSIQDHIKELTNVITQYCFVEYLTPDSIVKLNNHKRNTVILVDTDSNIINANLFVEFILDEILSGETFSRSRLYNDMICVNILANIIDDGVSRILDFYGRTHNMNEEARKELTMKNEFMFRRLFLMNKKKRYAASIVLREGNIMIPFKTEIKGVDFIKAGVTDEVTKRFTKILENHILFSEELELHEMMRELKKFEDEIYNDLKKGGVRFLKPQTYKSEGAYKTYEDTDGTRSSRAWSIPVFRAAGIWNEIYPSQKIYSLDKVKIIKLIVSGWTDLDIIKNKYPKEYETVVNAIFKSPNPEVVKAGLKVIAIPSTVKEIPKWIIPLIDYDTIMSDVMGSFRSVLDVLRIEKTSIKTSHGKANIISSLISI